MNRKDQDTGSTTLDLSLGDERNTPKEKQCRNANLEIATWKSRLSGSAVWEERWLRSGKRQEGNDLVDPDSCRTWRHIFRHRRSLWSLHKRRTRGRSAGSTSRPGGDRHQVRLQ